MDTWDVRMSIGQGMHVMIIRQLNEFTRESVPIALEPSRTCVAGCTYCFAALNSASQYAARRKRVDDDGSFERIVNLAYSSSYDATNFLQWCVKNSLVCGYANTVEPFQDVYAAQQCLHLCDKINLPLFIQTKGINFDHVKPLLLNMKDNLSVFISIPSLDPRVARRFEPGTPPVAERLEILKWLADNDIWAIAALSPYHEDWVEDPYELAARLIEAGADEIFLDHLHLNQRQRGNVRDPWIKAHAGGNWEHWPEKMIDQAAEIYDTCMNLEIDFFSPSFIPLVNGFPNTLPAISPDACFRRGRTWPYYDGKVFRVLENAFYSPDINPSNRNAYDSLLISWDDCLSIMEDGGSAIDQPFSYRSLYDLIAIGRKLPDEWTRAIGTSTPVPIREWFRAQYNNPRKRGFLWRHPWIKYAVKPDGVPWLDSQGNLLSLFDPDFPFDGPTRVEESLEHFRRLSYDYVQDSQPDDGRGAGIQGIDG